MDFFYGSLHFCHIFSFIYQQMSMRKHGLEAIYSTLAASLHITQLDISSGSIYMIDQALKQLSSSFLFQHLSQLPLPLMYDFIYLSCAVRHLPFPCKCLNIHSVSLLFILVFLPLLPKVLLCYVYALT